MPGIILWEGKSELDGKPIVLIAIDHSSNSKTGDMVQTYILRSDCIASMGWISDWRM